RVVMVRGCGGGAWSVGVVMVYSGAWREWWRGGGVCRGVKVVGAWPDGAGDWPEKERRREWGIGFYE
ncbi:hypothetical protein Tco_1326396, partial [Tanacetum coccineum]